MTVYVFDGTMDGLLTAVFDAFALKEQPEQLLAEGDALPLFCDHTYHVTSDEEKARRVWTGLEKKLTREALRLISVSWLSELRELNTPLFQYICKVFRQGDISRNFADPDVLTVTNIARRVLHEQLLRVPGLGTKSAWLIVNSRRFNRLTSFDLKKMGVVMKKAKYFITCNELTSQFSQPVIGINELRPERIRPLLISKAQQKRAAAEQQLLLNFQDE